MTAICLSPTTWAGSAWQPGDVWHEGDGERPPSGQAWAMVEPPGRLRLEWRETRGERTICTYRLEGTRRFFRLEVGPDDVHIEMQEIAPERLGRPPNRTGMGFATTSACYSVCGWNPAGAGVEPSPPAPPRDPLRDGLDASILRRHL
jgi:hypothetical protein